MAVYIFLIPLNHLFSDIDICIYLESLPEPTTDTLSCLSSLFKSAGVFNEVTVNHWAKVPVISLTTTRDLGQSTQDHASRLTF